MAMFHIVEFTDNRSVAVIPSNWLEGTSCAVWPVHYSSFRVMKAAKTREVPDDRWKAFPIRIIYDSGNLCKSFTLANYVTVFIKFCYKCI